jgi:hypothetical protein
LPYGCNLPSDLATVVQAWSTLPQAIKAAVLAMVKILDEITRD